MNYKILLPLLVIALFSSITFAQPSFTEIFLGTTGFAVEFPLIDTIQLGETHEFSFHVFNLTGGGTIIKGITCGFELFNNTGAKQLKLNLSSPTKDDEYDFIVNGNNFTRLGFYSFLTICNSSTEGGFSSEQFLVTRNGNVQIMEGDELGIIILISVIIIVYFLVLIRLVTEDKQFTQHGLLKLLFYVIAFVKDSLSYEEPHIKLLFYARISDGEDFFSV